MTSNVDATTIVVNSYSMVGNDALGWAWVDDAGGCQYGGVRGGTQYLGVLNGFLQALRAHRTAGDLVCESACATAVSAVSQAAEGRQPKSTNARKNYPLIKAILSEMEMHAGDVSFRVVDETTPQNLSDAMDLLVLNQIQFYTDHPEQPPSGLTPELVEVLIRRGMSTDFSQVVEARDASQAPAALAEYLPGIAEVTPQAVPAAQGASDTPDDAPDTPNADAPVPVPVRVVQAQADGSILVTQRPAGASAPVTITPKTAPAASASPAVLPAATSSASSSPQTSAVSTVPTAPTAPAMPVQSQLAPAPAPAVQSQPAPAPVAIPAALAAQKPSPIQAQFAPVPDTFMQSGMPPVRRPRHARPGSPQTDAMSEILMFRQAAWQSAASEEILGLLAASAHDLHKTASALKDAAKNCEEAIEDSKNAVPAIEGNPVTPMSAKSLKKARKHAKTAAQTYEQAAQAIDEFLASAQTRA